MLILTSRRLATPGAIISTLSAVVSPDIPPLGAAASPLAIMADRGDPRPVLLFFGGNDAESLTLHEEVLGFRSRMNLEVVMILTDPPADWEGETGHIRPQMPLRHWPESGYRRWMYIICRPDPMINAMESVLGTIKVPPEQVFAERFDMV
jgi:NAD(P)H-flavin reductase